MTHVLAALIISANTTDAIKLDIVKDGDYWYFEVTCAAGSGLRGKLPLEILYQDTKNKNFYPLIFFEETKYIDIKENTQTILRLYKSYKQPYALNYKLVIGEEGDAQLEYTLNHYDTARLEQQVLASAKDLFGDFLRIMEIEEALSKNIDSISHYSSEIDKLRRKNEMRYDIQEAYLESKGKFMIDVLVRMLATIPEAKDAREKKKTLDKLGKFIRDYIQILEFHVVSKKQFYRIAGKITASAQGGRTNECVNGLIELSSILPKHLHSYIRTLITEVKAPANGSDIASLVGSKLDKIPSMVIMRE